MIKEKVKKINLIKMLSAEDNFVCSDVAKIFVYFFTPRRTAVLGELKNAGIGIVFIPFWAQTC